MPSQLRQRQLIQVLTLRSAKQRRRRLGGEEMAVLLRRHTPQPPRRETEDALQVPLPLTPQGSFRLGDIYLAILCVSVLLPLEKPNRFLYLSVSYRYCEVFLT